MPLRAVIFDYGEVLSLAANRFAHREMMQTAALPEEAFEKSYWAYRLDYDTGILNGRAYWERIAGDAGVQFSPEQVDRLIEQDARMWMDINEPMLAWQGELKRAGLRTAILSNMGQEILSAVRRDFSWLNDFDVLVWSCEAGVAKPAAAIYLQAVEKLGIKPEEGLFIDNLEENIRTAVAVGLQGIVFQDIDQLGRDLRRARFDFPLPKTASLV